VDAPPGDCDRALARADVDADIEGGKTSFGLEYTTSFSVPKYEL
jgi:hypothetical protein